MNNNLLEILYSYILFSEDIHLNNTWENMRLNPYSLVEYYDKRSKRMDYLCRVIRKNKDISDCGGTQCHNCLLNNVYQPSYNDHHYNVTSNNYIKQAYSMLIPCSVEVPNNER